MLALVALALLSFFYFGGKELPGTQERQEAAQRVVNLEADKVERIELTNPEGEFVLVKSADGEWRLEKPLTTPADSSSVQELLSEAEFARRLSTLEPRAFEDYNKALESFGLKNPRVRVKFQQQGKAWTVAVGADTARPNQAYALASDGRREDMVIMGHSLLNRLLWGLERWRSRTLFKFQTPQVESITLRQGDQAVEVVKKGESWTITRPLEAPADDNKVSSYLYHLLSARAGKFVDDAGADAGRYGLSSPAVLLEVRAGGATQVLRIGQPVADEDAVYAQRVGEGFGVVTLPKATVERMRQLLEEVKDRRLAAFQDTFEFRGWKIERRGGLVLEGTALDREWILAGPMGHRADNTLVNTLIIGLRDQQAEAVLPKSPDAVKRNGLDQPQAVITLYRKAAKEGDPEPEPWVIRIGATRKGGRITVESSRLPYWVEMKDGLLALLPGAATDWISRNARLVPEGKDITRLVWKRPAGDTVLTRAENGAWKDARGTEVDPEAVRRVINLLGNLPVNNWKPVKEADFAQVRVTLEFGDGKDFTRALDLVLLGKDAQNLARLRGDTAAFTLTAYDFQILETAPEGKAQP